MADYLTLLARRSLGELPPVEPVRVHPYAERALADDSGVELRSIERAGTGGPATTLPHRPESDDRAAPASRLGWTSPASRSDGADAERGSEVFAATIGAHRDANPPAPSRDPGRQAAGGLEDRSQPPSRAVQRDDLGDQDLLVPRHPDRREGREDSGLSRAPMEAEQRQAGTRSDAVSPIEGAARPNELIGRAADTSRADGARDGPPNRPSVEIAIGTIEIRAASPQPPSVIARARRVRPKLSLDDYLTQRRRGER